MSQTEPLANPAWYADPIVILFVILALWVVLDLALALVRHVQRTRPHSFLVHRSPEAHG